MRNPHEVLIKPLVTEKSSALMAEGKYSFKVDKTANKIEIKKAVAGCRYGCDPDHRDIAWKSLRFPLRDSRC